MKIKCVKMQCPICNNSGSCQIFLNRDCRIRYARVRHYSHIHKGSKKPQFTYCRIEDLQALKTLLLNKGISLSTDKADSGQTGQKSNIRIHDHELNDSSLNQPNASGRSLVWLGHQPPTLTTRVQIPATAP